MLNYYNLGDSALIIKTGNEISETSNLTVRKLLFRLIHENIKGVLDFIPSYNELMICFDPAVTGFNELFETVVSCSQNLDGIDLPEPSVVSIPVLYGGNSGPDLHEVAETNNLSEAEVITIHSSPLYLVYMLGFTPGFCYLGGMDDRIVTPRRQTPRLKIVKLFDAGKSPEFLLNQGDYIKFYRVDEEEYEEILQRIKSGYYKPEKSLVKFICQK
jgi:inhibitor of KinA